MGLIYYAYTVSNTKYAKNTGFTGKLLSHPPMSGTYRQVDNSVIVTLLSVIAVLAAM